MRTVRVGVLSLAVAAAVLLCAAASRGGEKFPLQEGDTWVFAGDSITAQKLHTNYVEAFCFARYPKMNFRFRNSGVGGDTIPKVIARFEPDVAAFKPTVVSVELGMNDKGGTPVEKYIENMGKLTQMIQEIKARPVFITASPVNNGSTMDRLDAGNKTLDAYAVALKKFAEEQKAPYADQFHALVDVWGKNKPRESLANTIAGAKVVAQDDKVEGVEHLRKFLEAQAKNPTPAVSMLGDPVHPGAPGQLMMAAAILKGLGADGFVSDAQLTADGKVTAAKGCAVDGVKAESGALSFDRTDECLPLPIDDAARPVVAFDPTVLELSQYTLKVDGLKGEKYDLKVDGKAVGTVTAEELAKGVNLTRFDKGPIADQGRAVLAAVKAKEDVVGNVGVQGSWRAASKAASASTSGSKEKEALADLTKKLEEADAKIREAAKPRKMHFEITPVKA